eukprot:scaffold8820_cov63-Phaeocystis_antarctica.AAC.5
MPLLRRTARRGSGGLTRRCAGRSRRPLCCASSSCARWAASAPLQAPRSAPRSAASSHHAPPHCSVTLGRNGNTWRRLATLGGSRCACLLTRAQ